MHCPSCGVATHAAFHVWFWSPQRAFREIPSTQYISCESLCVDQKPPFPFVSFTRRFDCPERVVIKSSSFLLWNVDGKKKRATTLLALTCHGVTAADSGQSSGTGSPCGKRLSCFSVSLCLSRARLGKIDRIYGYKMVGDKRRCISTPQGRPLSERYRSLRRELTCAAPSSGLARG